MTGNPYQPPSTSEAGQAAPNEPERWPVRWPVGTITAVLAGYAVEAFFLGQGVLVLLFAGIVLPVSLVKGIRRRDRAPGIAIRVVLPLAMVLAAWGTIRANNALARARAERIVAAVEAYARDNGQYPKELEQLVPRYLERVPLAKYALVFNDFRYWEIDGQHSLMWVEIPPFGRSIYSFERKRWGYID